MALEKLPFSKCVLLPSPTLNSLIFYQYEMGIDIHTLSGIVKVLSTQNVCASAQVTS